MTSAVCTLFEGSYHYGVGALANSLYAQGFRGTLYAGHRGPLPPWATGSRELDGFVEFGPADGLTIRFISLTTKIHFAHYKPAFMLDLWDKHCPKAESLFYFDPDIVVHFPWSFFEEWASDAVALCEDVNSPMPSSHPKRKAWRNLFSNIGIRFDNNLDIYLNSGFIALSSQHKEFLSLWSQIISRIAEVGVKMDVFSWGEDYRFWYPDQEAMNMAAMATSCPISCAGKDGMGFVACNSFMLHAIGAVKPWQTSFLRQFIAGKRPTMAQRAYWENVTSPIGVCSRAQTSFNQLALKLAAFGSRFYGN